MNALNNVLVEIDQGLESEDFKESNISSINSFAIFPMKIKNLEWL